MNKKISTKQDQLIEEQTKSKIKVEGEFEMPEFEKDPIQSQYDDVYFVKIVTKDAAYFEITKKVNEQYVVNPRKDINSLGGKLLKIEIGSYIYQNDEKKTFKLHLLKETEDKKYLFIISSSYTQVGRTIINCILDTKSAIEKIHITLFRKDTFTNANISINSIACKWKTKTSGPGKYTREELEKYKVAIKHPKTGVIISNDYSALDEFLETELMKHIKIVCPAQESVNIIDDVDITNLSNEETFGDNIMSAEDFLNIDSED